MTTALHLDTIERLRTSEFADVRDGSGEAWSGPGYHLAALGHSAEQEDPAAEAEQAEQVSAEYTALEEALTARWGDPQVFAVGTLRGRTTGEGEIPEPWLTVCSVTDHVHLWRVEERWLVLCAAQWGTGQPRVLLAAVTVVDPP
ncbi:hypothetical protein LG634_31855 [Streptomyces bambusae]|uniref:hypothetical protein n=1 Tax=Streptomyces bambusae TaxID=1550616 RepID=UPI001CFFC7D3|nr:hypothetical protein [Streptomyces bambusae]MCB5169391.1 hypothetical protein [Streptomyces bambusae]